MDPLSLDSYVIKRPKQLSLTDNYECMDLEGNRVIDIKRNTLGNQYSLSSGDASIGSVHHKMLALVATFELMDGEKRPIGIVVKRATKVNNFEHGFILSDENGNTIALAGGDFSAFNYIMSNPDGTRTIASATPDLAASAASQKLLGTLRNSGAFLIKIQDKDFPRLLLLEFALAIDVLVNLTPSFGKGAGPLTPTPAPATAGGFSVKI